MIEKATLADKCKSFLEKLTLVGDFAGERLSLFPFQRDIVDLVYNPDKQTIFIFLPRGTAKTTLMAGIALFSLLCERPGREIYSAGASEEQAALIWDKMREMIDANSALGKVCKVLKTGFRIENRLNSSFYKAVSCDSKLGRNPSMVICDEIIEWENRKVWDDLHTGQIKRVRSVPKLIAITQAGPKKPGSLVESLIQYADDCERPADDEKKINDPSFGSYRRYLKPDDDWKAEANWFRVIPGLGEITSVPFLRNELIKAQSRPHEELQFRMRYMNTMLDGTTAYIPLPRWDDCQSQEVPAGSCCAALDLSTKYDLTCLTLLFQNGVIVPFYWAPKSANKERERQCRQMLAHWMATPQVIGGVKQPHGIIQPCGDEKIDQQQILEFLVGLKKRYTIRNVFVDHWQSGWISGELMRKGLRTHEFPPSFYAFDTPLQDTLGRILEKKLKHNGCPCTRWQVGNMTVATDAKGLIRPDKRANVDKMDFGVCLTMCVHSEMVYAPRVVGSSIDTTGVK